MEIFLVLHPGKIKAKIRNLIRCGRGRQSFCEPTPLKCVFPALQTNIPSALTSLDVSYYAKCTFPMLLWITFLSRLPAKSTVEIKKAPSFTSSSHVIGPFQRCASSHKASRGGFNRKLSQIAVYRRSHKYDGTFHRLHSTLKSC